MDRVASDLRDVAQLAVVQNGWDIEPEVEGVLRGFELDFEVAPDLLVKIVQLEYQVPLGAIFRDLLPFKHLWNEVTVVKLVVIDALHPFDVLENGLDCVLFHIGDDDVKAGELLGERPKADRMEVHNFIPHVFEDAIEGEVVVLAEAQLKESHLLFLLISYFTELVM